MPGNPRSVLILDGDSGDRAALVEALSSGGHRVIATDDSARAVRLAPSADLVLVAIGLPALEVVPRWQRRRSDPEAETLKPLVADGYAALRSMPADGGAARFPVVHLKDSAGEAAAGGPGDRSDFRYGLIDYVRKPFTPATLLPQVEEIFWASGVTSLEAPDVPRRPATPESLAPGFDALPPALRVALVVDPQEEYRTFLRELLETHQFKILEAGDGGDGLRLALAKRPWLIVTDVNMAGMDGFELCRQVRGHSLLRHTPLIFLSIWDDYRERYHAMKLGADDYVSKRTPARELLIRIQLVLAKYSDVGTRTKRGKGMQGGIELVGAPGMLQMCHLGRLTGAVTVMRGTERIEIKLRDGEITAARSPTAEGAQAVFDFIGWSSGHFEFVPGDGGQGPPLPESFDYLLLEGCRQLDESSEKASAQDESATAGPGG